MRLYYSPELEPRVAVAVARYLEAPVAFVRAGPRRLDAPEVPGTVHPDTLPPALVEEHRTLWDTDAIACRLSDVARSDFWPTGALAPELQMWLSWGKYFTQAARTFYLEFVVKPEAGADSMDEPALETATCDFHRLAAVLDEVLAGRTWLLDNRLTYADFRVATALPFAAAARLPVRGYPHILKWHERLCRLSAWSNPFEGFA